MTFELDSMLAADTVEVARLNLCRVLLMNDATYPWLILVPERQNLRDLHDLPREDHEQVMAEITQASNALQHIYNPYKINVAALGNVVGQLHIHIIARSTNDPAWPAPFWGHAPAQAYDAQALTETVEKIKTELA